jgi:hypothetical protein
LQYVADVSTTATLADGLLDDAAMFPPGNASAETAIREHLAHRASWYARLVGPLLVHVDRWGEFVTAHEQLESHALDVVVVGSSDRPSPVPAAVSVVGYEMVAPEQPDGLVDHVSGLALEVPSLDRLDAVVATVADLRSRGIAAVLKYRTGGTSADAFPSACDVATVIAAAVRADVPMKFTAGLHSAARHRDPDTGFEHHGFLNLLWAVLMSQGGVPVGRLVEVIEERDAEVVQQVAASWSTADTSAARATFVSFGCCGVTDPVGDLVRLGLVDSGTADGELR